MESQPRLIAAAGDTGKYFIFLISQSKLISIDHNPKYQRDSEEASAPVEMDIGIK